MCCHDHGGVSIDCESVKERSLSFKREYANVNPKKLLLIHMISAYKILAN